MEKWTSNFEKISAIVSDNRLEIKSGDKKYIFNNSLLPEKIQINDVNILSKPVELNMEFEDGDNGFEDIYFRIAEETDEKVVIIAGATRGNTVINETITAEVDGFINIDLKLSSFWMFSQNDNKKPRLNKMRINVSVLKEYSELFHYWPNDRQSILPAADVVNSGETTDYEFMFKPYIWTGNDNEGLGLYFGESFEPFNIENEDKCIVVKTNDETTDITLNMLDFMPCNWQGRGDHWCETLKPQLFTIGFQATPVTKKATLPYDEYYKRVHVLNETFFNEKRFQSFVEKGVKWIIIHEDWSAVQNYGLPYDEDVFRKQVNKYHEKGIKVMVYFGYEYSTITPGFTENCNDYLIKTINGNFTGGWQRKPAQRAFMACYRGGYAEGMRERVKYVMDELGVDGIYTDGTYVPWECANEEHGCGYTDANGVRHTTFPVMAVRKHVKELYKIVHERGGVVDTHNSSCCIMPLLSFADSCYDGENINAELRKHGIEFLSVKGFRAEYMGTNYGIIPNFIAYVPDNDQLEAIMALTLIHNVHVRPSNFNGGWEERIFVLDYISKVWEIFDKYDLNNKEWIPYFKNSEVKASADKQYISLYKDEKKAVAVISSFNGENVKINSEKYKQITNILTGDLTEINEGKAELKVKNASPQFFIFE